MKLAIVFVLVLNIATVLLASQWNVREICEGADVKIRTVTQLGELEREAYFQKVIIRDGKQICPQIYEMIKEIYRITRAFFPCGKKSVQVIVEFYEKYLANYDEKKSGKDLDQIPKPLAQFALAYVSKLTSKCRETMLDVLKRRDLADKSDFELISKWTDEKSTIAQLLDPIVGPTEILLPADLMAVLPNSNFATQLNDKIFGDPSEIVFIREVCERRFEPNYSEMFMPIGVLVKMGFTYKSFTLSKRIKFHPEEAKKSALWSRIVFLCEFTKTVQVDAELSEEILKSDKRLKNLGREFTKHLLEEDWPKIDQVLTRTDIRVRNAVESLKTGKSEQERLKERLVKQSWSLIATKFKYGEYKKLAKEFLGELKRRTCGDDGDESRELAKINDQLVDLLESKDETKLHKLFSKATDGTLTMVGKVDWLINQFVSHALNYVVIGGIVVGEGLKRFAIDVFTIEKYSLL